jgi:hypothetical protein
VDVGMKPIPPKLLGKMFVYRLEVLKSYQRTLVLRGVQTLKRKRSKKNKGIYEGERKWCAI